MKFKPLGIKNEKIKFRMPCKRCIVRAVCREKCDNYKNYIDTYGDSYFPIYLFGVICFLLLSILILSGFIWWPLGPIVYILIWVIMFVITRIKYEEDIALYDFIDESWKMTTFLIVCSPAILFCCMLGEEFDKYVEKNSPFNF